MEEAPKARKKEIMRVTLLGSFANFVLLVFKFVAGIWGHSSAMIADAVHSLSDFVTDIIVLLFVNISSKPKDESHDYGHGKYETLATSIVGIVLLCVGFGLFWIISIQLQCFSSICFRSPCFHCQVIQLTLLKASLGE